MLDDLIHNWWLMLARGLVAILFGVLLAVWPGLTMATMVTLFGIFVLLDGLAALALGTSGLREGRPWGSMITLGLVGLGVFGLGLLWREPSALALVMLMGGWMLARGLLEVSGAYRLRNTLEQMWRQALTGLISAALGALLLIQPGGSVLPLPWLLALYGVVVGVLQVSLGLSVYRLRRPQPAIGTRPRTV